MKLINYDGGELKVADEAFLIRPIRELFEDDKSKNHEQFLRQMSYLWFMSDPRSSYMYLTSETERSEEIKKQEGFGADWKPSEKLIAAIEQYKSHIITTSSLLLEDIRIGIDNVRAFFRTVNLGDVDEKGKPIYQISAVTGAIKQAIELTKMLAEAEKSLAQELTEDSGVRGSAKPSTFEGAIF